MTTNKGLTEVDLVELRTATEKDSLTEALKETEAIINKFKEQGIEDVLRQGIPLNCTLSTSEGVWKPFKE